MSATLKTVLCGIGGYGGWYLGTFLGRKSSPLEFTGFVDPAPEGCPHLARIRAAGTPIYPTLEDFYARGEAQLAILASPIQHHAPQTLCALEQGSHVLCEKPLCATVQEAHALLAAQRRTGRSVAVGYQGTFLESTQRLKADILAGIWGRPLLLKCITRWPRSREYYARNSWAGRIRDAAGRYVLDSPVNNATSHFLHHMLYLLGDAPARSAVPLQVEAGLYRAHEIENYDTAFLRCTVVGGAEIFFVTSHACGREAGPVFEFAFEKGVVRYELPGGEVVGVGSDGTRRGYGAGAHEGRQKVEQTVAAILQGRESLCGIEAALSQTVLMNGAQEAGQPIAGIPRELVRETEKDGQCWLDVVGLDEVLLKAYRLASLPGCDEAAWARPGRKIELAGYCAFPSGRKTITSPTAAPEA